MYKYVAPAEDEMFAMASALAMTSAFPTPGEEGCTEEEAMMAVDLLLCMPLDGEVSLSDAAKVIEVPKGRLGSAVNRLVRRGIMLRRSAAGETRLRMTSLGKSLAKRLDGRSEEVVDLTWKINPERIYNLLKHVFDRGAISISDLQGLSDLPRKTVEKAVDIFTDLGALQRDPAGLISCDAAFRLSLGREKKREEGLAEESNLEMPQDLPPAQSSAEEGAKRSLSQNDRDLLSWLVTPKSTSEVAEHLGVSRQRAQKRLSGFEAEGLVDVTQPRPRHSKFYQAKALPSAKPQEEIPMINPIAHSQGGPKASIVCDHCGTSVSVRCNYEMKSTKKWKPDEGQILIRAKGLGWEMVKGKHYCPTCKDERRNAEKKETSLLIFTQN